MVNALFVPLAVVSASTGVVIAVLLLLTPTLRKSTWAKWRCLVWVLLALRLLLPFQLPAIHAPLAVSLPDQVLITQAESTPSPGPVPGEASPAPQQRPVSGPQSLSLLDILSLVWAAGALGFLGFHLVGHLRFRRRLLRCQQRQETPQAEALAQALAKDLGLRRPIPLVVSCAAPSPMTLGFFHPLVVLPPRAYSQEELTFILRHELAHRKGGHLWCKLLLLLAQGVHWFNPLVHWMVHQAEADLELACDDQVVKDAAPAQRQAYAQTILSSQRLQGRLSLHPISRRDPHYKSTVSEYSLPRAPALGTGPAGPGPAGGSSHERAGGLLLWPAASPARRGRLHQGCAGPDLPQGHPRYSPAERPAHQFIYPLFPRRFSPHPGRRDPPFPAGRPRSARQVRPFRPDVFPEEK